MGTRGDFHAIMQRFLLQAAYSGVNPDGGWRYGPPAPGADGKRHFLVPEAAVDDVEKYNYYHPYFSGYSRAFDCLEDDMSAKIMIMLIAHRILGAERVALNISQQQYQAWMNELAPLLVQATTHNVGIHNMTLDLYDLNPAGIPIRVHTSRSSLLAHFFLRQYEFKRDNVLITVEPGDTVIEGGMCFGDTALFFAHLAGENGRVVGYEFEPNNLKRLQDNLALNPGLARRITVLRHALGETTGEKLTFAMAGPATADLALMPDLDLSKVGKVEASVLTIDDMVEREKLSRVDFIKLDVEGSELKTLVGARETLKRFKPKLALSAYHRPADIPELLGFVKDLDLGYKFYLDHFRYYAEETVLFAKTE